MHGGVLRQLLRSTPPPLQKQPTTINTILWLYLFDLFYKEHVEEATVKEYLNIINFKTFKNLRSKEHAEKTTHPSVLPCSMVRCQGQTWLKERAIAMEEPILHRRPPYRPNDLPTLLQDFPDGKHVCSLYGSYPCTVRANEHRSLRRPFSVPKYPAFKGKKHLMRIKPLFAKYFVRVDKSAKEFLQEDGSQNNRYVHRTSIRRRFLHAKWAKPGSSAIRDRLHFELGKRGLLPHLKYARLA